ncbi:MAG TPA: Hsp70 family protein [Bryobacteraceae bacterium]|nr:Hsp70 family protein [Bryobacteraceae bacterium]
MKYIVGIDLGTTNSGVAYAPAASKDDFSQPDVELFLIPQLVNPGEPAPEPLLPSFLYIPGPNEFPAGSLALPWSERPSQIAGVLAQKRGAENAGRLVSSAKSWLSHTGVDRTAPILPAAAPDGVSKVSPVAASRSYLEHIRYAWNFKHPDAPLDQQNVLITVPASFDAVARELTQRAAEEAGYRNFILLEEPQAAFYAWIERHQEWRERVKVADLILVVDIGGGTTDFTLIAVTEEDGELRLERVAVGEHILLGGDNMDLALARVLEAELTERKVKLDPIQFNALWQQSRVAKEALLAEGNTEEEHPITLLGRGTGLVGGTIKTKLRRETLNRVLIDGFLPMVPITDMPQGRRRVALQEIGLPYAPDAAITRHLARFLSQQPNQALPTHVLFNGGVLRARPIRERIVDVLNTWLRDVSRPQIVELAGEDLMHAVSRGATYYGLARQGRGVRIRGGVPRTYYVGIESAMPAVPGLPVPLKALTVAPFGMEEGTKAELPSREFGLVVGEPAEFRFFSSVARKTDAPGDLIEDIPEDVEELSPIEVTLPAGDRPGEVVRVTLESVVTETGVLELWCVASDGRRWKLEFNVRAGAAA